jgi:hydrogenase maturation protease
MSGPTRDLVLGLGNVLFGDDGVGPAVVAELEGRSPDFPPEGCELVDGGTVGLGLAPMLAGCRALVIVDALDDGGLPGTLTVLAEPGPGTLAGDLVALARILDAGPETALLVGIRPARIEPRLGLSDVVRDAVPAAAALVMEILERRPAPGGREIADAGTALAAPRPAAEAAA